MKNKTGLSTATKKHLLLGAGAIFKNFIVGTDTYETSKSKIIGATQGGNQFDAKATSHRVKVDGVNGPVKEFDILDYWEASLDVVFLEATKETIMAALGAAVVDSSTSGTYHIIKGDSEFKDEHYFENITFIGTLSGSETPVIIQIKNAINLGGLSVKFEDGKEGTIAVKFEAEYSESDIDNPPFAIYFPKGTEAELDVAPTATVAIGASVVIPVSNVTGTLAATSGTTAKATVNVASNSFIVVTGVAAGTSVITVSDGSSDTATCTVTVTA